MRASRFVASCLLSSLACASAAPEPRSPPEELAAGHVTLPPGTAPQAPAGPRCSGRAPPDPPRELACCYPAREAILGPIRATFPELRACYDALPARGRPEGTVVFRFHVAAAGDVDEACAEAPTTFPETFTTCALAAFRTARFPARTADDVKRCGLLRATYPATFSP